MKAFIIIYCVIKISKAHIHKNKALVSKLVLLSARSVYPAI